MLHGPELFEELIMATASIELSEQDVFALRELAQQTGKTQEQLLHEAILQLITQKHAQDRLELLRQAQGIWKERTDLPDIYIAH
jgi:hypothetical protein